MTRDAARAAPMPATARTGHRRPRRRRVVVAITGLTLALLGALALGEAEAQEREIPDEALDTAFVCPDGGYQSGCDSADIEKAVVLDAATPDAFAQRCLYTTKAQCGVLASGRINRGDDAPPLYWQILSLQPADGPHAEMIVMADMSSRFPVPLLSEQVDGYFDAPFAARDGDGKLIVHVPARNRGLGNADLVLFSSGQGWNWTSAPELMRAVDRLLPEGFNLASPVSFNFREGSGFGLVRRENDPGCCASGGVATIDFEQTAFALSVSRVRFTETHAVGAPRAAHPADGRQQPAGETK